MASATVSNISPLSGLLPKLTLRFIQADNQSLTSSAIETYQLEVESTALVRAAEDILALTRTLKEMWLFGKLDTLGEDERDRERREQLEKDVQIVKNTIEQSPLLKLEK